MKKKSLWRAKLMTRMAKDGDVDGLAEIITEMMEEPAPIPAVPVPAAEPVAAALPAVDPLVAAVAAAVEENLEPTVTIPVAAAPVTPVSVTAPAAPAASAPFASTAPAAPAEEPPIVVETPVEQPVIIDCGPQILETLQRIISLLSGTGDCDPTTDDCDPAQDDEPDAAAEAIAETAAEELVENVAEAAIEAVAETLEPDLAGLSLDDDPEDPIDALVAEILEPDDPEGETADEDEDEDEILSHILEPEDAVDEDSDDPDSSTAAADALRATLATFRPMLKRMTPKQRQRFNSDVAACMKKLTASQSKAAKPNAYAALRKSADHNASARNLGQQIMASRNANLKKA